MSSGPVPPELRGPDQWICWRNECRGCGEVLDPDVKGCQECGEKATKRPINPNTGRLAKTADPENGLEAAMETWSDYDTAVGHFRDSDCHGVGFVFSERDQMAGIDLDDCRDPETGEIEDWALGIIGQLSSFSEVSPSGTGVHIYVFGTVPEGGSRRGGVEMYDKERYFTVTGDQLPQSPNKINYRQEEIERVHEGHIDVDDRASADVDVEIGPLTEEGDLDFTNDLGESLEEIQDRDQKLDDLLSSIEAGYESASEADMATASKLWFWRFNPQQIADIIRTYRARPKVIDRDDYLELTISKAAGGEQYDPRPRSGEDVQILDDRTHHESIAKAELPVGRHFVLDKPPREGGSHASIKHLSRRPLVILTARHAIGEHHLGILADVMPERACAVHLIGRRRSCENADKEECPKATETREEKFHLQHEVKDLVHQKRVITKEDCPEGRCAHQFLQMAEPFAHAVVTVPQMLGRLDRDFDENNLLVDEEQALGYFRPVSTELVQISQLYEPDGTKSIQLSTSNIGRQFKALRSIRERILEDQAGRQEAAEEEGRGWRRTTKEIDVMAAIDYLEEVKSVLGVTETTRSIEDAGGDLTVKTVLDEFRSRLESIERPEPRLSPDDFRDEISEYVARFYHDDRVDPGDLIETALFAYDDRPFDFKRTGPSYTLRMIGGRQIFEAADLRSFNQVGVIAGPEGELFFQDLGLEAETIIIDSFRYADRFVIVPMGKETKKGMEGPTSQRRRAKKVSEKLNEMAHPHIAITGTKETAENHLADLDSGPSDIIGNPTSPAKDIYTAWSSGSSAIIYENSVVSRGIDAPPFDISIVASSGFATPYWEARAAHYQGEDDDEYLRASAIESELKSRELTNAVLRLAPTPSVEDVYGTKFIVCADWDVPRIRYLQDRVLPRFAYADSAASFLSQVTIRGAFRHTVDDIYDEVNGDEREFIDIVSRDLLKETGRERPSYTLDELTTWRENRYISGEGTVERLLDAVAIGTDPISTPEINDYLRNWSGGRITAGLRILEKKGVIKSFEENDGTAGPPTTYWLRDY